jgi:hypothetical protein
VAGYRFGPKGLTIDDNMVQVERLGVWGAFCSMMGSGIMNVLRE